MTAVYHSLASGSFQQDWTDTSLIAADNNWDGVASIVGYRGDALTGGTGTDPQTITTSSAVVNVEANETNPNSFATGGVAEFQIANPTIALNGSGTADAPYVVIHLDATGREDIIFS
ncbi:MAG: endonuclease/exonuclease/phosphatase, partial [Allosphingosinicella sp.]